MSPILVIKLSALGDFVLALAAMKRIRLAHPDAVIDLLTTTPYAALAEASPYVDHVWTDGRPAGWRGALRMAGRLRRAGYARVYDLQTSSRSSAYLQLLRPRPPEWSGIAWGCSHPHRNPNRDRMHTLERQADQLKDAGIWPDAPTARGTAPPPDLSWLLAGNEPMATLPQRFGLRGPYALLVPGGSAHRLDKRWPAAAYAQLARALSADGLTPVVLGGMQERELADVIVQAAPRTADLTGRTDFLQIAGLGALAALAVGNDTGPTHLLAAAGAPTLALFSAASDPALTAPRGRAVAVLQRPELADLDVSTVLQTLARPPLAA